MCVLCVSTVMALLYRPIHLLVSCSVCARLLVFGVRVGAYSFDRSEPGVLIAAWGEASRLRTVG